MKLIADRRGDGQGTMLRAKKRQHPSQNLKAGKHRIALACLASTAIFIAQNAYAQQSADTATDEEALMLQQIVVTASSVATDLRNAPASVSVINSDTFERKAVTDISEAIRTQPGVNVGFGSNGTRGVSIRGLGSSYTLILIDGKRVNAGLTTMRKYNGDLDWVPIDAIERIEVVRGPMSTLYGSDALGGVVNIITKKNSDRWRGSVTAETLLPSNALTGSKQKLSGYVSGPIIPDVLSFSAFGNVSKQKEADESLGGGVETPRGTRDFDLTGRLTWTPSADQVIDLEAGFGRERYIPYLEPGEADTPTTIERTSVSLRHVGEWDFGTSTVTGFMENAENKHTITDRLGDVLGNSITVRSYTLDGKLAMPLDYFWTDGLTIGSEFRYEELDDPENLGKANTVTGTSGSPQTDNWTAALFAENKLDIIETVHLTTGLRYDYHDMFGSHLSPRAYITWDVTPDLTFKTGWAQAFKAPDLRQLNPNWVQTSRGRGCGAVGGPCEMVGNPDLKPETSNSFEGGLFYENSAGLQAGLNYFFNEIEDKITSARVASLITAGGTKYVQQINVDRARSQGLEGNFSIPLHDTLTWTNSFTWLFESKNLETNLPLSADPEISVHTELVWQARENLSFTLSGDYYGKQVDYVTTPETLIAQNVEPYAVANISTRYSFNENVDFKAGINNIFDAQPKSESNFVENGRTFFLGVTTKF